MLGLQWGKKERKVAIMAAMIVFYHRDVPTLVRGGRPNHHLAMYLHHSG